MIVRDPFAVCSRWLKLAWMPLAGTVMFLALFEVVVSAASDDVPPIVEPKRTPPKIRPGPPPKDAAPLATPVTEEHKKIRLAVQKGVNFLRSTQTANGTWTRGGHGVGYAAMPALALLEVGVPASDPAIQRAAYYVRSMSAKLDGTYELGLAILFLDKLGNKADGPIIRALALRLIGGQTLNGGWGYTCPVLTPQEEQQVVWYLQKNHPKIANPGQNLVLLPNMIPLPKKLEALLDPLTRREKDFPLDPLAMSLFDRNNPLPTIKPDPNAKLDLFDPLSKTIIEPLDPLAKPIVSDPLDPLAKPEPVNDPLGKVFNEKDPREPRPNPLDDNRALDFNPGPAPGTKPVGPKPVEPTPMVSVPKTPKIRPAGAGPVVENKEPDKTEPGDPRVPRGAPVIVDLNKWPNAPEHIQQIRTYVQTKGKGKGRGAAGHDDNSNTQFAILGLWAARRHGVPVALTLSRLDERFRSSQSANGAWNYHFSGKGHGGTPAMTCVGLLGLGIAHGAFQDVAQQGNKNPVNNLFFYDPAIQKGLEALSQSIVPAPRTPPAKNAQIPTGANLYFLWSVERVCVMYHLPTLRQIDWHAWGADILLPRQTAHGSWNQGGYPGSNETIDTAMALLFLGRVNLSRDLSESLRQNLVVLDPAHNP